LVAARRPRYDKMIQIEAAAGDRREGMAASTALLLKVLEQKGCDYDAFVLSL
jgi:hypothetical protein